MTHPTKAQVQTVIDNLSKMVPMALHEDSLCMLNGSVCGTIHCHGGWYYLSKVDKPDWSHSYTDGADMMAEDLGLIDFDELTKWAGIHERIWGNEDGQFMFSNYLAFTSPDRPRGALTLQHIVDHWKEVQSRLPE